MSLASVIIISILVDYKFAYTIIHPKTMDLLLVYIIPYTSHVLLVPPDGMKLISQYFYDAYETNT